MVRPSYLEAMQRRLSPPSLWLRRHPKFISHSRRLRSTANVSHAPSQRQRESLSLVETFTPHSWSPALPPRSNLGKTVESILSTSASYDLSNASERSRISARDLCL